MSRNVPRKHHYVPKFYQKGFADAEGLLWVYDRARKTYHRLPPEVVCCERDFYSVKPEGAPRDPRIESEYLSRIDAAGATVIRALGTRTTLDGSAIQALAMFAAHQFTRSPSYRVAISRSYELSAQQMARLAFLNVDRARQSLEQLRAETGHDTSVTPESMVEAVQQNQIVISATERPFLEQMVEQAANIARVLEALDWQVLIAPQTTGFITCDNPVVLVPPPKYDVARYGVGFATPGAVKYFPLTRHYCLRLGDFDFGLQHRKIDGEMVRTINLNVAATSERFIMGPSCAQLESAVDRSGSQEVDSESRFLVELVEAGPNGALEKFTIRPKRWFYPKTA
jgi:hypothetical protein